MSQIVKEIAKKVAKEATKKTSKQKTKPSGSNSQQSFAKQLFEPSREDEFKILSSSELLEALGIESLDSAKQKLKRSVTQLSRLQEPDVDPIETLRAQFREGQPTDKRGRKLNFPSGTSEDSKRRDRTDEPVVPSLPVDTGLDIPTGEPPGRDEPTRPTIDWPWRAIDKPVSDDVYPTDDTDEEPTEEDKPRLEKDVFECEKSKEIAQLFGLPEPVCERHGAGHTRIRGRVI